MTCQELEILLADYVDDSIRGEEKSAIEAHLAGCEGCAELARDAAGAVAFMERASIVEPPPELVTRILFEITDGASRAEVRPSLVRRMFGKWIEPLLQPRFTMGMAMTILSFAMLGRFAGINMRQLKPSDLDPVKVYAAAEDRVQRTWERTVKYYENLRVVFEIQTQLKEWTDQQPPDQEQSEEMSTDAKIVGYCRACGKALDEANVRAAHGTIYCEEHLPMTPSATSSLAAASADATTPAIGPPPLIPGPADTSDSPYTSKAPPAMPHSDASPGLAFVLGLIPGVGAIYNGQYAKGLVHVIIIGLVISILSNGSAHGLEPLVGLMLAGFWFYMAFEAYHTAQRRQQGPGGG